MKTIKILHLFPTLLSLYGEHGNVAIMKKYLEKNGYEVDLVQSEYPKKEDFENAQFVYIGSGTEDNLIIAIKRLFDIKTQVKNSIENSIWLATGNALTVFSKTVTRYGNILEGLGVFDFSTDIDDENRFAGDVLTNSDNVFKSELVGFINTSSTYKNIENPLDTLLMNENLGNDKAGNKDGMLIKGFFATQMIGPFLVKNPSALQYIYEKITGEKLNLSDDEYIVKAYNSSLFELKNRLEQA